jgi:hypothetical protein
MIIESVIVERPPKAYLVPTRNPPGTLADEYAAAQREMLEIHNGAALAALAKSVLSRLPAGPVSLLASSTEGLALAAVCAALKADGSDWQRVHHGGGQETVAHVPVVVEPVDGGRGWRQAILRRHPDAVFVVAQAYPVAA